MRRTGAHARDQALDLARNEASAQAISNICRALIAAKIIRLCRRLS